MTAGPAVFLVNGERRHLTDTISVRDLVDELGLSGKRIAVERNGDIVPRSAYDTTMVAPGDRLEIVAAVGGG